MKKSFAAFMAITLAMGSLSGCSGKPVSAASGTTPHVTETAAVDAPASAVKTGLYVDASIAGSKSADVEENGQAKFDVTVVAVTVDGKGIIESCVIDSIPASVAFDASGTIISDISGAVLTKNELGEAYGMKDLAGSRYEWNEQTSALAAYAVGKTVKELRNGALDERGYAADADLASTASIYLGGYVSAIEAAVNNAQHLGAASGDRLVLATLNSVGSSKLSDGDVKGVAQLDADIAAVTMNGDVITSCYIDSLCAKVNFDDAGIIATDLAAPVLTKNALGEDYGLKKYAGSGYEWNEQAAAFAAYVTGKTAGEVAGIAVNEREAPADTDLAAVVTISIAGFQTLIAKAAAQ